MARIDLQRDHTGKLHATIGGDPIAGSIVKSIDPFNDIGMGVTIIVPLAVCTVGELNNVVPLVRVERK